MIFNNNWEFKLEGEESWKAVTIPHDWLISDTRNLYKDSTGMYRKTLRTNKPDGERFFIRFDGVYQDSTLYVNGVESGQWKNGYTAFSHEITSLLKVGANEILLKVVYESPNTRWYSGAGIYRDCWLFQKPPTHFIQDGIYITTKRISKNDWQVKIESEVESAGREYDIRHSIEEYSETLEVAERAVISNLTLNQKNAIYTVKKPQIWDIDSPKLYELKSELLVDGKVADTAFTRFGFREIAYSPEGGFFLNGRHVPLRGVCQHHDLGALGSAIHKDVLRRQLQILRDMGVNAIRTAHNPPAAVYMELCDEMGFVVMSEFTDVWMRPKTQYDYARFFEDWAEKDVASWIRRDRNCPSIIMWSLGNEIYDTHASYEEGSKILKFLMNEVDKHDRGCFVEQFMMEGNDFVPSLPNETATLRGNAPVTFCSNFMPWENTQKCADIIKLIGYNYGDNLYEKHRTEHPDWIIYGSETAAIVQSRGIYHFPLKKPLLADDDLQCSALGNSATSWGAKSTESLIENHKGTMGQFIWTGTDYIGEPTPYHTKNSYFGPIDTAGFPKDPYYIYKSAWSNETVLHLYPYWDWSPGQPIDVRIATNAPKTELFLNGKSLGFGSDFIVPYEPGVIKAVAYDKNGKVIAEIERRSFGDATSIKLETTRYGELDFIEITAEDAESNPVENANNRIKINVNNGKLLGLDNGDSTDYDQYQGTDNRRLFSGKLLAIVKPADGGSAEVTAEFITSDIPIRKIELTRNGFTITAKILPENATFRDIEWRLTDSGGIDSPLGNLMVDGTTAILHPKGDGDVYVRAATKNGKDHISLISLLPMEISGYGKPFLDPYSFISAGLYNLCNDTMTNGNERGIATFRDKESQFGFTDIDFGKFGSDEITMWLFPLSGEPFTFEVWQGMPEDGRLLATPTYDKGSRWNTYIEATYTLPEKLTGIQTLGFVFREKVHVKGFVFKSKTFEKIPFAACDNIYGDTFDVCEKAVENIGNNVTITFDGMNFEEPATKIELSYRSALDKNTIRLDFETEEGVTVNMLTLPIGNDYGTLILDLEKPLTGMGAVHFIFLPGSQIDLEELRFLT